MAASETLIETPELWGLVLVGGRSIRMGEDKCHLSWRGMPFYQRALDVLSSVCSSTYISCRVDQIPAFNSSNIIPDKYGDRGPMGAILSAMTSYHNRAWLVLAVDLPMVDQQLLMSFSSQRQTQLDGTCAQSANGQLHPLCCIYEPHCDSMLQESVRSGQLSLQKFIAAQHFQRVVVDDDYLININTAQDWLDLKEKE